MLTVALSHVLDRGVSLEVDEVLAITQGCALSRGNPAVNNIELVDDGTVHCVQVRGEPSVPAIAALADELLPETGVPPALRYAVARGLGQVTAPPFASLAEFSAVLARFEKGERRDAIRRLLSRGRPSPRPRPSAPAPAPAFDPHPAAMARIERAASPEPVPASSRASSRRTSYVIAALLVSALTGFAGVRVLVVSLRPPAVAEPLPPRFLPALQRTPPSVGTSGMLPRPRVPRALCTRVATAFSPAFSANGTAIFFQTGGPGDRASAIEVASSDKWPASDLRIVRVIDDGARNYHAQPSPDGRSIAFDSDREGQRAVYVADSDGSHVRRVSGPGYAALPTWSPDGRRLAIVRAQEGAASVWNLWLQPLDGRTPRRLTGYHYGQTWSASWFPDGKRIAFSHEDQLIILDLSTGAARHIASPVRGRLVRTPAVSPDGSRIVFQVHRAGAWMLDLRDGSMECVLADPTAEEFAWAPDGRRFAFHSRRDGEWGVYVLSAAPARS